MEFFKSKELLTQALEGRVLRNQLIASNIANIDTPFYQAKDVDFESVLLEASKDAFKTRVDDLKATQKEHFTSSSRPMLNKTNPLHQDPFFINDSKSGTIFARDGHLARNDANTVDLDVETTELSKNALMISAIDAILKKQGAIAKLVIDTSAKLN